MSWGTVDRKQVVHTLQGGRNMVTQIGGTQKVRSYCAQCGSLCPIVCTVQDNVLVAVEPDRESSRWIPLCPKGLAGPEIVYDKSRLQYPMRRTMPKDAADAGWQRISWDEALDLVAGEIKRIIRDNNLDPRRDLGKMRVIFPDLKDYSSLIFEIFSEYKIPFSLTKGLPLSSHPISNIFLYILGLPLNHFSREGIFNLFSSSMIKESSREEEPEGELDWLSRINDEFLLAEEDPSEIKKLIQEGLGEGNKDGLDIFLFDEVARKVGLNNLGSPLSGLWEGPFLRVKNYYRDQYRHAKDAGKRKELICEYYRFFAQIGMLEKRLSLFENLAKQNNPHGVEACLFKILDMLGFPENIVIPEEISGSEAAVIRAMMKRDIKAYSTLKDLILASADEAHIESTLFRIKEGYSILLRFYSIFEQRLNNAYLLDERNPNVVRISEWLEIRGRSFDYIFAGGLIADKFPLREEKDFILPETPNKIFRMKDLICQSKHLFVHLLRNYRKGFYLSYPRYTEEREKMPTPVLIDLESMVKSGLSLEGGRGILEEVFKWEQNPYFTSNEELLNATFIKNKTSEGKRDHFFPLNRIIFRHNKVDKGLIRGINVLRSRWASDGLFEYDGLVGGSGRFGEFLKGRSDIFSPSQLETLANCPMRYLFEHIYGLKTMEDLGEEVSSRDMGKHIHSILKDFFQRLKNEGKNVADIGLDRAFSLAMEVADGYFMNHPFLNMLEFFDFQKKEFLSGLEQNCIGSTRNPNEREGIFAQLLRFEEREFRDNIPGGLEYRFGQEGKPPVLFGGTRIKGYIDRFDMVKGEEMAYIYDYKTGITLPSDMGKKGLSFQLPAYILALKSSIQFKRISASFYSLRRDLFLKESLLKQRTNDHCEGFPGLDISGVSIMGDYVDQLIKIFEKGRFHQSADEMICPFCQFKYACFKDMRRINHLLDSRVEHQIYSGKKNLEKWRSVDEFRKGWKTVSQSMKKALTLKTESGMRRHFESVMDYGRWLKENHDSLPLKREYIEELFDEIDIFEKKYRKTEPSI